MGWLPTADGYEVSLQGSKVVCRKGQGKQLKSLPKALKDDDVVVGLRQLAEWLARHETSCRAEVERWMIRSLPVPAQVLGRVWADEAWRAALTDAVVVPVDEAGDWILDDAGFLREADVARGVGVVNLDGESVWLTAAQFAIPHPVRLADLDDLREFAAELGVAQGTTQLFREIWRKPEDKAEQSRALGEFSGGRFEELRHLTARATKLGYPIRGGYATCRVWEGGTAVTATVWVGADDPSYEAETGELSFTNPQGETVPVTEVGPIAWSEGMRMAAALYAGRVVKEESE
ncbi:DUF4132 domain-containing protein [Luedemannella helvata]|uniref:DUF4132 domain-containing protein n=1 Tax=Luedemannella helvata TaxID=349315 RepID=A0ABN2JWW4_9ACTN